MKTLVLLSALLLGLSSNSWAQIKSLIKEETKANSKGTFNALVMELPGTSSKEVGKAWSKFIKKYKGKTKFDRRGNEYITEDASIKDMSDNTVDIIAKVEERGQEGTVITVWYNLGVSYLSSKDFSDRYPAGEAILRDFARNVSADMIEEELKEAEKLLKDYEGNLSKLEKDEKQRTKDIETYKSTITKMEQSIVEAENDVKESKEGQGKAKVEIDDQKKVVDEIKQRLESVK
ncbi:MAG: hypothetical protein ACRBFS_13065 [Aureispira sp.]